MSRCVCPGKVRIMIVFTLYLLMLMSVVFAGLIAN